MVADRTEAVELRAVAWRRRAVDPFVRREMDREGGPARVAWRDTTTPERLRDGYIDGVLTLR